MATKKASTKKAPTKKGRNKPKESKGMSRGSRADDYEKHIRGSDKSPIEQKKVASKTQKAKTVAKSAGKYLKRAGGLAGMAAIGAASYVGGHIGGAMKREKETRSKLVKDAKNEKKTAASKPATKAATKAAPEKKHTSEIAGMVKTKGGDYAVYKKDSSGAKDFRSAFASARKAGKSTFEWRGRKYNTKTK